MDNRYCDLWRKGNLQGEPLITWTLILRQFPNYDAGQRSPNRTWQSIWVQEAEIRFGATKAKGICKTGHWRGGSCIEREPQNLCGGPPVTHRFLPKDWDLLAQGHTIWDLSESSCYRVESELRYYRSAGAGRRWRDLHPRHQAETPEGCALGARTILWCKGYSRPA